MAEETTNNQESTETENQVESTETENQELEKEVEKTPEQINQEAINKKFDRLTYEKHAERKKREKLEAEHQETLKRIDELESKSKTVEIPPVPDAYDPEYATKLQERDKAIQEKGKQDAAAEVAQRVAEERAEQQKKEQDELFRSQSDKMYLTAEKAGIKKDEILKAEQTVSLFITDPMLAQFMLAHEDSAYLVNHLANNVQELEKISRMLPVNASAYIASEVLPEAKKFKPGIPTAPDPLSIPSGGPASSQNPYLKGVKLE